MQVQVGGDPWLDLKLTESKGSFHVRSWMELEEGKPKVFKIFDILSSITAAYVGRLQAGAITAAL